MHMPVLTEPGPWLTLTCSNGSSAPYSPTFHSGSFKTPSPHLQGLHRLPPARSDHLCSQQWGILCCAVSLTPIFPCVTCGLYQVCAFLPPFVPTHSLPPIDSVCTVATMTTSLWHVSACWPVSLGIAGLPCHTHLGLSPLPVAVPMHSPLQVTKWM